MQRSSLIATVIAAAGILVAGSVASVAVINAAATGQPESQTLALVSDDAPSPAPSTPLPSAAPTPNALPTVESSQLPDVAPVGDQPSTSQPTSAGVRSGQRSSNDDAAVVAGVTAAQARATVMSKGDGVAVLATSKQSHQGYPVWAVRIVRANGQVITGYVHRTSGVVFDWEVNQHATPTSSPSASNDDVDDDDVGTSDDQGIDDAGDDGTQSGNGNGNDDNYSNGNKNNGNSGSGNSGNGNDDNSGNSGSGHSGDGDHDSDDD